MTTRSTLEQYLSQPGRSQAALARRTGVTQGAVHQMLRSGRCIFVVEHDDGSLELQEIKRIGRKPSPDDPVLTSGPEVA
ncbi:MAG: Cro/CI family transcriptional regulator [Ectothiorhodospiraceae bacterium]|nr:Cro/CI family transcriptional regulator [Ectothiorhodospiraceae bacterium]